jgi:hypothetical protein
MSKPSKLKEKFYKALECYDYVTKQGAVKRCLFIRARLDCLVSVMCKMDSKIERLQQRQSFDIISMELKDRKIADLKTELAVLKRRERDYEARIEEF